jgi:hypothetical protein
MSLRWHQLFEAGDDFLTAAPFRYVNTIDVAAPPDKTWAALTADDTLVSWSPLVTRLHWTTPRPFGVGTTREVTILRLITARERYYRWEQGRRKTFTAVQVTVPGVRGLAEDYVVEPTPDGSRLIWTLGLEPHPVLRSILRLANPITAWMIRGIARGIRPQVE